LLPIMHIKKQDVKPWEKKILCTYEQK
jgi:hypothetical protein